MRLHETGFIKSSPQKIIAYVPKPSAWDTPDRLAPTGLQSQLQTARSIELASPGVSSLPKIRRYRLKFDPESLTEFPFLRTAIEDFIAIQYHTDSDIINRRHIINLMYDTLEFTLYEILLLHEQDIYQNGQNTIGFDAALSICKKLDLDIPLIGTVRTVQKLRGDTKHHAQSPDDTSFRQVLRNFPIIMSRLVYEHFHAPLGDAIDKLPLLAHHAALFETHRRRRNHNWSQAAKYVLVL